MWSVMSQTPADDSDAARELGLNVEDFLRAALIETKAVAIGIFVDENS